MLARLAGALGILLGASLSFGVGCSSGSPAEHLGSDHSPDTGQSGYCRTTTCEPPLGYPTADGQCEPPGWSDSETCTKNKESNAPVWWRSACIGYDLNVAASRDVSYDAFKSAAAGAFLAWTTASCPSDEAASSRVSIDVRDLGPVTCAAAKYDKVGANQNVITFHDDAWPYEARDRAKTGLSKSPTVALTTVTFDPQTGEIYDADIELNSADYTIIPLDGSPSGAETYDLQTVLTHEVGHFFGLAHSPSAAAVMYASGDTSGATRKRALTASDVRGICAIYSPDDTRNVSALVDASNKVAAGACDPTPRHGFTSSCN
jgi:hypothetical protein